MASKGDNGVVYGDTAPFATLPCICCGKQLESAMGDHADNQPYAGTTFHSRGHYGSTVFDPMDGSFLEVNVCDECMKVHAAQNRIAFKKVSMPHKLPYKFWEPEIDG